MTTNKNKKSILTRILFGPKTLALAGLVIIILISFPLAKRASQSYKINQEIKELEEEIVALEKKNSNLDEFIKYLDSGQFVEEQARLQFGLKKDGEEVAVIKENDVGQVALENKEKPLDNIFNAGGISKSEPLPEDSNPKKWLKYFFGKL